ncbi:MAG TPA: hypothetical protein VLD40_05625 [Dissulfurispiraceae bacterium]|nr:hypothetical protein [Dissulfurispiraceae bacterium]
MKHEKKRRCGVCEVPSFERNNYFYGKLMTVRDFLAEQCYFNEKRWLINRMILGWGVVCGLDVVSVDNDPTKVAVKPGLAIDCCGREILVCEDREIELVVDKSSCHKSGNESRTEPRNVAVCLLYRECKTEPLAMPPIACDQKEKGEFNRVRDSFEIKIIDFAEQPPQKRHPCPHENESISLHEYVCERLGEGCPECSDSQCVILATMKTDQDGLTGEIDTCTHRKLVYGNSLLYDLIECLHHNYIGTWLVLGPIFNVNHQNQPHSPGDGHPPAKDIIMGFDTTVFDPAAITGDVDKAPEHGKTIHYKNGILDIAGEYEWQTRGFLSMDWMNIHDIEDNIHQHLPGDHSDPFNPENPLNFSVKHHAIAYFLVYVLSPEERETRLFVRSDDALRVWFNGNEITDLQCVGDRDITDFTESGAKITLKKGHNVLMAAVAETHYEWGFSARIEDDGGLRFTTIKYE